jgi:hypothetical protein
MLISTKRKLLFFYLFLSPEVTGTEFLKTCLLVGVTYRIAYFVKHFRWSEWNPRGVTPTTQH